MRGSLWLQAWSPRTLSTRRRSGDPRFFAGQDAEWSDWNFQLAGCLGRLMTKLPEVLKLAETHSTVIDQAVLTDEWKQVSNQLFYVLSMSTKKKALKMVRKQEKDRNGFEAYRRLCKRYNPEHGGRSMAILSKINEPEAGRHPSEGLRG